MRTVADALLDRAVGWRQGPVAQLDEVPATLADVDLPSFAAVPEPTSTGGTSGGASRDQAAARLAALAEAMERYAAARCPIESVPAADLTTGVPLWRLEDFSLHSAEQQAHPDFPYPGYASPRYAEAWTMPGNRPIRVPAGLVGLDETHGLPATSSGLAAGPSTTAALLRGLQELVERDAFTTTWLHGVAARRVKVPAELADPVRELGGEVTGFDLTPAYSPHPVVAVAGTLPLRGEPRPTVGLACRAGWAEAMEKAWVEWCQGTVFVSVERSREPDRRLAPHEVTDFDRHAVYYATDLDRWATLPWWSGPPAESTSDSAAAGKGAAAELGELVDALTVAGVRLAYRELTTSELLALGVYAVRVLSPDLAPLHANHNWPHLGGRTPDLGLRYPWATGRFPSPDPHPLG